MSNVTPRVRFMRDVLETRLVRHTGALLVLSCGHKKRFRGAGELPRRSHCPECEALNIGACPELYDGRMSRTEERELTKKRVQRAIEEAIDG